MFGAGVASSVSVIPQSGVVEVDSLRPRLRA